MPIIETGTYTGDGGVQNIDLAFTPDFVLVAGDSEYIWWRTNKAWHGRGQGLASISSAYNIGSREGGRYEQFRGQGFRVENAANTNGTTYHYLAIRDNDSQFFEDLSWIGNATAGRDLDWTSATPEAVLVKRGAGRDWIVLNRSEGYYIPKGVEGIAWHTDSGHVIPRGNDLDNIIIGPVNGTMKTKADGGDDLIYPGLTGGDWIFGGDGTDAVVLSGPQSDYTVARKDAASFKVTFPDGTTSAVMDDVERLIFNDGELDLTGM